MMPYRPTKFAEQLLLRLYKLLQQMKVICGMLSCYLTDSAPNAGPALNPAWTFGLKGIAPLPASLSLVVTV